VRGNLDVGGLDWRWRLSEDGRAAAQSDSWEPRDPQRYLARLRDRAPSLDSVTDMYVTETLRSFNARCFLASSVMLGVAAEQVFGRVAEAFLAGAPSDTEKLRKFLSTQEVAGNGHTKPGLAPRILPGSSPATLTCRCECLLMWRDKLSTGDVVRRQTASAAGGRQMSDSAEGGRVLVVDDEPNIVELISMALRFQGFTVETAASGQQAIAAVSAFKPHLIVLDVMLPDMDGFAVAGRLGAQRAGVSIIFLTARDSTEDKVRGLSGGGDDYMTKPFSLEELVARIRTILRRTGQASPDSGRLVFADLELDEESREVTRAGAAVELTATEYRLLRYLMLNPRRVLTRAQLLDHVWNYDFGGDGRVLETYISYLRKKLDQQGPSLIRTVRGVGYSMQVPRS
jgi:two-component system, OmpR family, response regulator